MYAEMQKDGKGCPPRTPCDFMNLGGYVAHEAEGIVKRWPSSMIPEGCLVTSTPAILPVHIIPSSWQWLDCKGIDKLNSLIIKCELETTNWRLDRKNDEAQAEIYAYNCMV